MMNTARSVVAALVVALCGVASASAPERPALEPTRMAVTVDDLPAHGEMPAGISRSDIARGVLRALKNNGIRQAYGFANGTDIADEPGLIDVLKMWLKAGYPVGNHTFSHRNINEITADDYIGDIGRMDRLLQTLSPASPLVDRRRVFRYPFLDEGAALEKRDAVRKYLFDNQYKIAQVTIDFNDWAWNDAYTRCVMQHDQTSITWLKTHMVKDAERSLRVSSAQAKLLFGHDIAHILLLHDGAFEAVMLDTVLKNLHADGVTFITLDEALTDPVYQIDPRYLYEGGRGFLEQLVEARAVNAGGDVGETAYSVARLGEVCKQTSSPAPKLAAGKTQPAVKS
jgi:peptidoglycan-N-acetylglucosamine deacetylase